MKNRTHLKAGGRRYQHNETLVRDAAASRGLRIRTGIAAGTKLPNHNETLVRDTPAAATRSVFRVRTTPAAGMSGIRR